MAFDAHEITTLTYRRWDTEPSCPNRAIVGDQTISRVMTWADLQSGCENFQLGAVYNPDFDSGMYFSNGGSYSIVLGTASMLSDTITRCV